jgi:RHS repeat-associated protein
MMTYNSNQNLAYDGTNTLSYDVENRMVQAQNAVWGASTYLYDPLGQRKQKVVGVNTFTPVATDFVLAGGEEIADYYETSASWRLTVRGAGGLPLVTVVPAAGGGSEEIVYVHHDMKGSTVALTVPGGSGPAETYTYSDYGQPQSGSWLAYQYAGYRYDSETGLYYMPARSYSPALGRFLQTDPSGFGGGFNLYAYAGNDPINQADPTGLSPDGGGYTVTVSESVPTTFMRLFGISSLTVSVSVKIPDIVVKCRGIETYHLGALGFHHCDAEVVDGSGVVYSLSAGPMGPPRDQVLQAWATPNPTTPFTGTTIYSEYANQSVVQGLISLTETWEHSPIKPRYNPYAGPNSNTWLKFTFAANGISLPINTYGDIL